MKHTYIVDLNVAAAYAKRNCKHCHGRGILEGESGEYGSLKHYEIKKFYHIYCSCVRKNAKKYG